LPTDRCVAEWWIASPRVRAIVEEGRALPVTPRQRIEISQSINQWKTSDLLQARREQARVRSEFERWLSQGLAVTGYQVSPEAGAFLLEPSPPIP